MLWSEVKRWAKEKNYQIIKEKKDDSVNGAVYHWSCLSDSTSCGTEPSVSKVATAIFNHMTNNEWTQFQEEYKANKQIDYFDGTNYG
jgi:hypothetical protein